MVSVNLYSEKSEEIEKFLSSFYNSSFNIDNGLKWEHEYENPIEVAEIIGVFVDNSDNYKLTMLVSLDSGVFINVTDKTADSLIRYLYERYPY